MVIKVIPIRRLPRKFNTFDYLAPEKLKHKIQIGQLVNIPFKKSSIAGIVFSIHLQKNGINNGKPNANIKTIHKIVNKEPLITQKHLKFLGEISKLYGVPLSTLIKMSLPPMRRKKLSDSKLTPYNKQKNRSHGNHKSTSCQFLYFHYNNQKTHSQLIKKIISGPTLILVPETYLIDEIHKILPLKFQSRATIWHSGLSDKQKFERWLKIRNKEKTIIIGTRSSIFLPIPNLETIIIDYEHEKNHKHWDQAPRFNVKDTAKLLSNEFGVKLNLMSYSPSCESYFNIHKNIYSSGSIFFYPNLIKTGGRRQKL